MNIVMNLVLALQILTALVMIGLVLIQHGKGADMGASFGSGASGSLFGATGSANFLSRSTAVCAAVFFVCTLVPRLQRQRPAARRARRQHPRPPCGARRRRARRARFGRRALIRARASSARRRRCRQRVRQRFRALPTAAPSTPIARCPERARSRRSRSRSARIRGCPASHSSRQPGGKVRVPPTW